MDNKTKEYLLRKMQGLRKKVFKAKKFENKKDWKDFRANINKEETNEQ